MVDNRTVTTSTSFYNNFTYIESFVDVYNSLQKSIIDLANTKNFWKFIYRRFRIKKYIKDIYLHLSTITPQYFRQIKRFGIIHKHRQIKLYV